MEASACAFTALSVCSEKAVFKGLGLTAERDSDGSYFSKEAFLRQPRAFCLLSVARFAPWGAKWKRNEA